MMPATEKEIFQSNYLSAVERTSGKVSYLIVAVKLPTGAKEIITNTMDIPAKVQYYLDTYDDNLCMKRVPEIEITDYMFV